MNLHAVLHLLGQVLLLLALFLLVPAGVALVWGEHESWSACLRSSLVAGVVGVGLVHLISRQERDEKTGRIPGVLASARNRRNLAAMTLVTLFFLLVPWDVYGGVGRLAEVLPELGSLSAEGLLIGLEGLVLLCAIKGIFFNSIPF